jgi:hypothetical protein
VATLQTAALWRAHPKGVVKPCDPHYFVNQCAIRLGVALAGAGVSLASFTGARCFPRLKHHPPHILRAQELASWLLTQTGVVGPVTKYKGSDVSLASITTKQGIIFIKDGWGATDHIDVLYRGKLAGGDVSWLIMGKELWVWQLN